MTETMVVEEQAEVDGDVEVDAEDADGGLEVEEAVDESTALARPLSTLAQAASFRVGFGVGVGQVVPQALVSAKKRRLRAKKRPKEAEALDAMVSQKQLTRNTCKCAEVFIEKKLLHVEGKMTKEAMWMMKWMGKVDDSDRRDISIEDKIDPTGVNNRKAEGWHPHRDLEAIPSEVIKWGPCESSCYFAVLCIVPGNHPVMHGDKQIDVDPISMHA
ncbi:hypothetical protein MUK42_36856 [Musa troglodytarum]|uniref:Uncharacterized protein n=1 Tax=Musa troglodytarum TaxID=320322 RepID=A0A9E7FHE5_9LILI|nr:hypothetical protein MUK42_36856 [Musa troglodytarum]